MAIKKGVWIIAGIVLIVVIVGVFFLSKSGETSVVAPGETPEWMDIELKNVNSGETFKISDFAGKPVLLESFAVWCPICTQQQRNVKTLHDEVGDDIISISLDTDPNEDEARVLEHTQSNGFKWYYAVSPIEMTESLIDEFGTSIVNAPSVPMILICEDGSFKKLGGFGVRSVSKLKSEVAANCGG